MDYEIDCYGNKRYLVNGRLHREDDPAIEYTNSIKYWYLNNEHINCSSNEEFLRIVKLKAFL